MSLRRNVAGARMPCPCPYRWTVRTQTEVNIVTDGYPENGQINGASATLTQPIVRLSGMPIRR